jgi:4-amino-4-deoxy-L-arabinose transferase-like glycosyltransferase
MHFKSLLKLALPWLSALVFCALIFLFYPYRTTFQFDTDEGVNLAKARLVEKDYALYRQVWSDQPPVFTLALARLFPWAEQDLYAARNLVLAFAGLLVACLAGLAQKLWGGWAAVLVALLVLLVPFFPALSVSVMIGLPAISLAFVSLAALVAWHSRPRPLWLLLSGAALGFSVMTKLFTGFLAPVFLVGICLAASRQRSDGRVRMDWRAAFRPLLIWSVAFVLVVAGLALGVVGPGHLAELLAPHLQAGATGYYQGYQAEYSRFALLSEASPLIGLAVLGAWEALRRNRWLVLYPLAWMVGGFGFLAIVSPLWYHHTLLVTLPACLLAAGAIATALTNLVAGLRRRPRARRAGGGTALGLILLGVLLWQRLPPVWQEFAHQPYFIALRSAQPPREQAILEEIAPYREHARWMFTDLPMFAFRADILVPPELAALTSKRLASGELSQAEVARLVQAYRPEVILIGRFEFPALSEILSSAYVLHSSRLDTHLYLRADLPELK